jgi:hypothetical protein
MWLMDWGLGIGPVVALSQLYVYIGVISNSSHYRLAILAKLPTDCNVEGFQKILISTNSVHKPFSSLSFCCHLGCDVM